MSQQNRPPDALEKIAKLQRDVSELQRRRLPAQGMRPQQVGDLWYLHGIDDGVLALNPDTTSAVVTVHINPHSDNRTYIELTDDGTSYAYIQMGARDDVIIFADDGDFDLVGGNDFNLHINNDFNLRADRDINLGGPASGRNLNLYAPSMFFSTLPTSDPGVSQQVWLDGDTVKVSP